MSAETERLALYRCALGVAQEAIEAFTAPRADTSNFSGLKVALAAIRQVMPPTGMATTNHKGATT